MSVKNKRREAAQKRAKRKKMTILAVCSALVGAFIIAAVVYTVTRPSARVFAVPGNLSVTLYENGRFSARLAHNVNLSGTFTEETHGDVSLITFAYGRNMVSTQIENDVLMLPFEWRTGCAHGHAVAFPLRR